MTPELIGIMALFGSIVALGVALFGALKWFADRVDRRFVELERRMDVRFEGVDRRFDSVDRRFDSVDTRFEGVDRRFEGIDRRLQRIEADLSKLKEGQARPDSRECSRERSSGSPGRALRPPKRPLLQAAPRARTNTALLRLQGSQPPILLFPRRMEEFPVPPWDAPSSTMGEGVLRWPGLFSESLTQDTTGNGLNSQDRRHG